MDLQWQLHRLSKLEPVGSRRRQVVVDSQHFLFLSLDFDVSRLGHFKSHESVNVSQSVNSQTVFRFVFCFKKGTAVAALTGYMLNNTRNFFWIIVHSLSENKSTECKHARSNQGLPISINIVKTAA
jgi:hypothetical protein